MLRDRMLLWIASRLIAMTSPEVRKRVIRAANAGYRQTGYNAFGEPVGKRPYGNKY